jgi:putative membrane protein
MQSSEKNGRFVQILAAAYGLVFLWSAVGPEDRATWALENLLVLITVSALIATHRRFQFSNLSCVLIFSFLVLHSVGSHYTYSLAPPGDWMGRWLGGDRNHYDRLVHFAFGLLLAYPLREVAQRLLNLRRGWAYAVPLFAVVSFGAGYEIIESWAARVVDPEVGLAFLGSQGDEWDSQKDMSVALYGAVLAFVAAALASRARAHWLPTRLTHQALSRCEHDEGEAHRKARHGDADRKRRHTRRVGISALDEEQCEICEREGHQRDQRGGLRQRPERERQRE